MQHAISSRLLEPPEDYKVKSALWGTAQVDNYGDLVTFIRSGEIKFQTVCPLLSAATFVKLANTHLVAQAQKKRLA